MSAADRLRQITAAVEARDAAPPPEPVVVERTAATRVGCDLPPAEYRQWQRWLLDAADATGRGKLTQQEALYWLITATLKDEVVARHVRALIMGGGTAPPVQHKRGGPAEPEEVGS